jgi:hypothetical protein
MLVKICVSILINVVEFCVFMLWVKNSNSTGVGLSVIYVEFCVFAAGSGLGGKTRTQWMWAWVLIYHSNKLWVWVTPDNSGAGLDSVKLAPVGTGSH